jgi:hypothetical protein
MAPELLPPDLSEGDVTIEELIGYHKQVLEGIRQMGVDECVFSVFSSALERLTAQVGWNHRSLLTQLQQGRLALADVNRDSADIEQLENFATKHNELSEHYRKHNGLFAPTKTAKGIEETQEVATLHVQHRPNR